MNQRIFFKGTRNEEFCSRDEEKKICGTILECEEGENLTLEAKINGSRFKVSIKGYWLCLKKKLWNFVNIS